MMSQGAFARASRKSAAEPKDFPRAASLVAISAIQLLKDFLRLDQIHDFTPIGWQIGIHLTFVVSGVLFAVTDWIGAKSHLIDHEVDEGDDS